MKYRRRRVPNLQFRDDFSIVPDLDSGCWLSTFGGAAVGIQEMADRGGEVDQ
jgi:hypothetical protein